MHLILGLGNPGPTYKNTRHNVGFMLADRLAETAGKKFKRSVPLSLTCCLDLERVRERIILAKPQTYMNLSGKAVRELLKHYSLNESQLLVVYDDLALPLGVVRIRRSGSSGGHQGIESVIEALSTTKIARLRVGISAGEPPPDYSGYVLDDFKEEERRILDETFARASQAIETILSEGLDRAMSFHN